MVRFNGRMMIETQERFKRYIPLQKEQFEKFIYKTQGDVSRTRINDLFSYACSTAKDLTQNDRFILFGHQVWDTEDLVLRSNITAVDCIWRSPYASITDPSGAPVAFIMSLAGGDQGLYDDIMQSLAPLVMARKPDGVIWWIGDGAKNMSMLAEAIHQLFPHQLSSVSIKRLIGGRDTPLLNETFGNIVKEVSDGQVESTDIYKSIATHEDFRLHKYHHQSGVEIRGNVHHIFLANQMPTFSRKGYSTQWRTFVIPFSQHTVTNSKFERQEFTAKMSGLLIAEMCRYANRIKQQGYRYEWSAATIAANPHLKQ